MSCVTKMKRTSTDWRGKSLTLVECSFVQVCKKSSRFITRHSRRLLPPIITQIMGLTFFSRYGVQSIFKQAYIEADTTVVCSDRTSPTVYKIRNISTALLSKSTIHPYVTQLYIYRLQRYLSVLETSIRCWFNSSLMTWSFFGRYSWARADERARANNVLHAHAPT